MLLLPRCKLQQLQTSLVSVSAPVEIWSMLNNTLTEIKYFYQARTTASVIFWTKLPIILHLVVDTWIQENGHATILQNCEFWTHSAYVRELLRTKVKLIIFILCWNYSYIRHFHFTKIIRMKFAACICTIFKLQNNCKNFAPLVNGS